MDTSMELLIDPKAFQHNKIEGLILKIVQHTAKWDGL